MILLSEDGKSLEIVKSWEEIATRPGFRENIDPKKIKPKQILAAYRLEAEPTCGISTCKTKHKNGYLISCESGIETNIGHVCGKEIFGVEFIALKNKFKQDTNAQRYRENIESFQNKISNYFDRVGYLKNGEDQGEFCYKKMHFLISRGFESKTINSLKERAKRNDTEVSKQKRKTEEEIALSKEIDRKDKNFYTSEVIYRISGLSAVKDYPKIKKLSKSYFGCDIEVFEKLKPYEMKLSDLRIWHNWINKFDKNMKDLENIITDCKRFFNEPNLENIRAYKQYL